MNKKQRLVAKKHRKNKARIKALRQNAISAGKKVDKKTSSKVATTKKPVAKKATPKKTPVTKATTTKPAPKKAPARKSVKKTPVTKAAATKTKTQPKTSETKSTAVDKLKSAVKAGVKRHKKAVQPASCLLYTSDAADE